MIDALAQWWDGAKLALQLALDLSRDGPHAHVGLLIMVALLALTRGRWPVAAWGAVLLAELVNEALDLSWAGPEATPALALHDLIVTLTPPSLLLVAILALRKRA